MRLGVTVVAGLIDTALACIWLFKANTFRHKSLEVRGYELVEEIERLRIYRAPD